MSAATAAAAAAAAAGISSAAAIATAAAAAPNYQLLGYEQQIVQEMVEQDALCIMGVGLGWHRVIAAMLQMHDSSSSGERERERGAHAFTLLHCCRKMTDSQQSLYSIFSNRIYGFARLRVAV
jgi:hypothetical protein